MIRWLMSMSLFVFGFAVQAQTIEQAQEAYQTGNYSAAIGLFESALAENGGSAALYYNLGSAYYADRQYGQALVHYLRADRLAPRDTDIAAQIQRVRAERIDGMLTETDWVVVTAALSAEYLTLTETAISVLVLWGLFFCVVGLRLWRGGWATSLAVYGIVLVLGMGVLAARVYVDTQRPQAVVTVSEAQMMSGPGFRYLPLFTVYDGLDVRIIERREQWVRVALPDGRQGWIEVSAIERVVLAVP